MMQRAILFDLDGTLVDSVPDLAAAVNGLLAELDRPALGLAQVTSMVGDGTSALVERALAARLTRRASPALIPGYPRCWISSPRPAGVSASAPTSRSAPPAPSWPGSTSTASLRWCWAAT